MSIIFPACGPLDIHNKTLKEFSWQISKDSSPILVPVVKKTLPLGNCYWNVEATIKKKGGEMVLGWYVSLWPGSHFSAVHHAIYLDKKGMLWDVSQRMTGSKDMKHTVFIPDNSVPVDLNRIPAITSKYLIIDQRQQTVDYIDAYLCLNKLEKENSQLLYDTGFRCESNRALANRLTPQASNLSMTDSDYAKYLFYTDKMQLARADIGRAIKSLKKVTGQL